MTTYSQMGTLLYDGFLTDPFSLDAPLTPPHSHSRTLVGGPPLESFPNVFDRGVQPSGSNLIFSSSDAVSFYIHTDVVLQKSPSAFRTLLQGVPMNDPRLVVNIPEPSSVLDIILHILYAIPFADQPPLFETVVAAIDRMPDYGIIPKDHIVPQSPSYAYLLAFAPLFPLELYALAAHHEIHDLAVSTSSHLLTQPLASIDDETAKRIGPIYLKRLLCLHVSRFDALKRILLNPPHPHPPTTECDVMQQKQLTRAWALVSAHLAWDARPDISTSSIQSAFSKLQEEQTCSQCQEVLATRLKDVITRWTSVNRTI